MGSQGVAENFATDEKKNRGKKKERDDFIFAVVFIVL